MKMFNSKCGVLRWAVNTNAWHPTRHEWVTAMRLVGNEEEKLRINRFVFKKDAKHALVGRLLIRKCCEYFLGSSQLSFAAKDAQQPNQLILVRSDKGKPLLMKSKLFIFQVFQSNNKFHFNSF